MCNSDQAGLMNYIVGHENWTKAYTDDDNRDRIWVYFKTSDEKEIHLKEYAQECI